MNTDAEVLIRRAKQDDVPAIRQLKNAITDEARKLGFHTLIARVAQGSDASIHLNESSGFVRIGTMKEVGRKFGKLLDVHLFQKMLK